MALALAIDRSGTWRAADREREKRGRLIAIISRGGLLSTSRLENTSTC